MWFPKLIIYSIIGTCREATLQTDGNGNSFHFISRVTRDQTIPLDCHSPCRV